MFWADRIAEELRDRGPQLVDDMKTPSGPIHVGAVRGVIVHDLAYRALKSAGLSVRYTYCIDDTDPMDSLPASLDAATYREWMGVPFHKIPAPDGHSPSYAHQFALDFIEIVNQLGAHPEILWTSALYRAGTMDTQIRLLLDHATDIDRIYQEVSTSPPRPAGWVPFQPVCENCGKVGTTLATEWDGSTVAYRCEPSMVKWAQGCGFQGRVSPFGGTGKLPWKVEWPAKWAALGITVEGEGSDHATAGGSRHVANAVATQILGYQPPYDIPYEFFLLGGRKMATSKGVGVSARAASSMLPPALLRFLMTRPKPNQRIDFDPMGDTIPRLFDEYDRCARALFDGGDADLGRMYALSQVHESDIQPRFLPRFSTVAAWVQIPHIDPLMEAADAKGAALTDLEVETVQERGYYARNWVENYAPDDARLTVMATVPPQALLLNDNQRLVLQKALAHLQTETDIQGQAMENQLYSWGQDLGMKGPETFSAIYLALLGKPRGPRAGWLISALDRGFVVDRFQQILAMESQPVVQ